MKSLVFANKPVNYVSFWDAARFTNWLNNGQGSASTETGSYTLGSVTNPANGTVTRNGGANWVMASENEWYKAAYYDPTKNSGAGGYWLHATRSDTLGQNNPFTAVNGANYNDGDFASGGPSGPATTDVGAYTNAASFYGTFDQAGNLSEWNDTISGSNRGLRGGAWGDFDPSGTNMLSSTRSVANATINGGEVGFRLVSVIPEPSTYGALMGVMALGVVMMRRRKARGAV